MAAALTVASLLPMAAAAAGPELQLSADGLGWNISVGGRLWYCSPGLPLRAFVGGRWHSSAEPGGLRFDNASSPTTGADSLGPYTEHSFAWTVPASGDGLGSASPQPCAVEFDAGGDYNGNDIRQTHAPDPLGCCGACAKEPQCKVWTWSNRTRQCWLKTAKGPRRADPDRTSGTPNAPLGPSPGPAPPPAPAPPTAPVPLVLSYRVHARSVTTTLSFPAARTGPIRL